MSQNDEIIQCTDCNNHFEIKYTERADGNVSITYCDKIDIKNRQIISIGCIFMRSQIA